MKTSVKSMFLLAFLFFIPNYVKAASSCSYSEQAELNEIVSHVNANYEVVEVSMGEYYDIDHFGEEGYDVIQEHFVKVFDIHVLNITEDIYIKVYNDYNDEVKTFRYNDTKDGVATFRVDDIEKLVTYTIEVYSNKYSCAGEMFRKFTLTTPMYNNYSERPQCEDNKDFYYCQEFINSENISFNEFFEKIKEFQDQKQNEEEKKQQEENKSFVEKIKEFYKENAIVIHSIGVAIVVMGVATTVVLIKKKRSRVL